MFGRKRKPVQVNLTQPAYERWLRACRPQTLPWFLTLPEGEQEALAGIGEAYVADIIAAIGYATQSPVAAAAISTRSDRAEGEGRLLESLSSAVVARARAQAAGGPGAGPEDLTRPQSMGGIGARRQAVQEARTVAANAARSWLGRAPDGPA